MYLLHRKKIDNYVNISLFLSYYEVTVATRSSPYPAQRVTAVTRSSPYSDQMVDQHLEATFKPPTALNVSGVQDTKMSPRDRSPVRNPSHTQPLGKKNTGTSWDLTIWLCCSWNKLLVRLARGELAPQLSLVSPKVFSPFGHWWSFGSLCHKRWGRGLKCRDYQVSLITK